MSRRGSVACGRRHLRAPDRPDDWDRYAASQWLNVARWLDANADDPEAEAVRTEMAASRRGYLAHGRDHLGWGVFVFRPAR